jgi:Cys-rich repeat protein
VALSGAGAIRARGASAQAAGADGGGGGGAGGSVYLRFQGAVACSGIDASGGAGASVADNAHGPGGGGAGGRVLLQAGSIACTTNVGGGAAGTTPSMSNDGAAAGGAGATETPPTGGYCAGKLDCSGTTPVCDVLVGICRACVGAGDCTDPAKPICETKSGALQYQCVACTTSDAALCKNAKPLCLANDTCGCTKSSDCPQATPVCDPNAHACVAHCLSDGDCTSKPLVHCDTAASMPACVQCITDAQCPTGRVCSSARACVQCTQANASTCSASGSGAVCLAGGTCGCNDDHDCGDATSGRVCDPAAHACTLGCRGTGGNTCAAGLVCTSTDATLGLCHAPDVDAGAGGGDNILDDRGRLGGGGAGCAIGGPAESAPLAFLIAAAIGVSASIARRRRGEGGKR